MKFRIQKLDSHLDRYRVQARVGLFWFNTAGTKLDFADFYSVYHSVEEAERAIERIKQERSTPPPPKWKTLK